ncbi:hypothetical protein EST38_g11385 [Candolleomyces aberdarensis]|uniref:GH16 domain-containing protein n=1 Tax=Candolleomyces aberdarensis TaxID=2316362 RepID=A0A4Q2D7Q8_9AGAR|nr:hypothetical protein EST38_g11385 [Candolleomyces aberdarensis]
MKELTLRRVESSAGYPIFSHFTARKPSDMGGFNIGGINSTGQIPSFPGNYGLVDRDTPADAFYKVSYTNPSQQLQLVFSDEFNTDGRTFYPGDDPYWEAVDLHYWATNNLEWYDPEAVVTRDGFLEVSLSRKDTHGLQYQGGMISTWNKFCFTGGLLEVSVTLPGANNVMGLWPAVWSMGNLGRAGYGASLEGMYVSWIADARLAWTLRAGGVAADDRVQISGRPVPQEPMYLIINLGMSENFGGVDFDHLTLPATMRVDWVRVYQPLREINVGCDPADFPTQAYINENIDAYTNPNLTTWTDDYGKSFPKNRFLGQC